MKPNEIFGRLDDVLDNMDKQVAKKLPETPKRKLRSLPKMQVSNSKDAIKDINFENVVHVPSSLLKSIAFSIDKQTSKLNRVLLRELMPLLLSYETSTNYTKAALKEGLKLEIDFDSGLADCVKHIGYLAIATHFVKSTKLPIEIKKRFIRQLSDRLADQAVVAMVESNKSQIKQTAFQELQAVVYGRNSQKTTTHTKTEDTPKVQTRIPAAVQRKRK